MPIKTKKHTPFLFKKENNNIKNAYTLIEILIVISIISVLFTVGYSGFRDFSRRQQLETFARKIRGDLSMARQKAISGEKPDDAFCRSPKTLDGYIFEVVSNQNNNNYSVSAVCSGGSVELKEVKVPSDLSLAVPSINPLLFKVLSQGTNIASNSGNIELVILQKEINKISKIYITPTGEIN